MGRPIRCPTPHLPPPRCSSTRRRGEAATDGGVRRRRRRRPCSGFRQWAQPGEQYGARRGERNCAQRADGQGADERPGKVHEKALRKTPDAAPPAVAVLVNEAESDNGPDKGNKMAPVEGKENMPNEVTDKGPMKAPERCTRKRSRTLPTPRIPPLRSSLTRRRGGAASGGGGGVSWRRRRGVCHEAESDNEPTKGNKMAPVEGNEKMPNEVTDKRPMNAPESWTRTRSKKIPAPGCPKARCPSRDTARRGGKSW